MVIRFEETGGPMTAAEVAEFEATLPGPLPQDYRTFLLEQNGGWAPSCWWPPERGPADFVTSEFYSVGPVQELSESITETRHIFRGRIPDDYLAIGGDVNGNQLCLALLSDEPGSVWFYDHELEVDEGEEPCSDLLTRVCGTFDELLETVEVCPDLPEMRRRVAEARA